MGRVLDTTRRTEIIHYRENREEMARLRAAAQPGESPHQTARRLVRQTLDMLDRLRG